MSSPAFAGEVAVAEVRGLVCDFCAQALKKVFAKDERVDNIDVSLDDQTVTIYLKQGQTLGEAEITDLISRGGYDVDAVRWLENQ